jgi:murein DD-endopeptidase MepM/ murein hydrolase activator NlpD
MKRNIFISALLSAVTVLLFASCRGSSQQGAEASEPVVAEVAEPEIHPMGFNPDTLAVKEGIVKKGQFFSTILNSLGLGASEAYALTNACDSVFDVRSLRVGNNFRAYYTLGESPEHQGELSYFVYDRDRMSCVVFDCKAPYGAWIYEKPITYVDRYADVTISSSLWNDMIAADASPLLIVTLSDIYAWTIDFFGLQKGDQFQVLYQEKICDGEVIAVDTVRYAVFSHGDQKFPAVMFDQKDGGNLWWNEKGESMRKAFLKAPLQFSRISSGFTYARKHPITRKVQPHTGVDYAAPTGTPVMSIGDGVVVEKGYKGAGGNTVKIKHNSVYTTAYLHLSKYASGLKVGQRVKQGDVIGYVGSTGRSTGPHLDFRVWKNGTPINPLTMDSPPAEPINEANKPAFEEAIQSYQQMITNVAVAEDARVLFDLI